MRNQIRNPRGVVVTHVVNPHQFYFKYLDECMNIESTKFDIEIQAYAVQLRADMKYEQGHLPAEDELVIFFHIIFNKWIRGRVISIDEEVTLWCVDNGVMAKCRQEVILPLATKFHDEMKLVHLGGLSILPTEKAFNNETSEIEIKLSEKWDSEMIATFKSIVNNSKTITFTEEFELSTHKFGLLTIQSKSDKIVVINNTLVEMNKGGHTTADSEADLSSYVTKDRLEYQLFQSENDGQSTSKKKFCEIMNLSKKLRNLSTKTEGETSSIGTELYDDSASSSNASYIFESKSVKAEHSNLDNLSKRVMSESESCNEFDDSESVAMSTITLRNENRSSSSLSCRNESTTSTVSNFESDYECNLRSCSTNPLGELRPPLQSTLNWIDSMSTANLMNNTSGDNKSFTSSISSLHEIESTSRKSSSPSSSMRNNSGASSFNDVIPNNSKANIRIVNNLDKYQKNYGVPGGYAKNCLDTFGGLVRRN